MTGDDFALRRKNLRDTLASACSRLSTRNSGNRSQRISRCAKFPRNCRVVNRAMCRLVWIRETKIVDSIRLTGGSRDRTNGKYRIDATARIRQNGNACTVTAGTRRFVSRVFGSTGCRGRAIIFVDVRANFEPRTDIAQHAGCPNRTTCPCMYAVIATCRLIAVKLRFVSLRKTTRLACW